MHRLMGLGLIATAGLASASLLGVGQASAQVSGCDEMQKLLQTRQSIVATLNTASKAKRKMTPQQACGTLGKLVSNGSETVKFATANQAWCQIPDQFIEGIKADNAKAATIRNQACNAVKQQAALQRKAQQQAQQGGANPFSGSDSITGGALRVPQGAL